MPLNIGNRVNSVPDVDYKDRMSLYILVCSRYLKRDPDSV